MKMHKAKTKIVACGNSYAKLTRLYAHQCSTYATLARALRGLTRTSVFKDPLPSLTRALARCLRHLPPAMSFQTYLRPSLRTACAKLTRHFGHKGAYTQTLTPRLRPAYATLTPAVFSVLRRWLCLRESFETPRRQSVEGGFDRESYTYIY